MKSRYRLPNYAEIIRGNAPLLTKKKCFCQKWTPLCDSRAMMARWRAYLDRAFYWRAI